MTTLLIRVPVKLKSKATIPSTIPIELLFQTAKVPLKLLDTLKKKLLGISLASTIHKEWRLEELQRV